MKDPRCGHHGTLLETPTNPIPDHYGDGIRLYGACRECFPELFNHDLPEHLVLCEPVFQNTLVTTVPEQITRCHIGPHGEPDVLVRYRLESIEVMDDQEEA